MLEVGQLYRLTRMVRLHHARTSKCGTIDLGFGKMPVCMGHNIEPGTKVLIVSTSQEKRYTAWIDGKTFYVPQEQENAFMEYKDAMGSG